MLWIEIVGQIIIARMRGEPTEALIHELHERVVALYKETGCNRVLYDALEMTAPPVDVPMAQWKLDEGSDAAPLIRAVVVPDSKLAYLGRMAFGATHTRIFYNDLVAAVVWLEQQV